MKRVKRRGGKNWEIVIDFLRIVDEMGFFDILGFVIDILDMSDDEKIRGIF